jgi:hypothetical protein
MRLKPGVRLTGLTPQMALGAVIVRDVYAALDPGCSCTVTSGNDSKHSAASLHYDGKALDYRTHDFTGDKQQLRQEVKAALGNDFDVVLEGVGTPNEHLHVEYDPK